MSSRAAAGSDGNYRIEVTNFGPIGQAGVDLRPLTVFAGPSNTGKSYLATLVYALHRCFDSRALSRAVAVQRFESLPDHDAISKRVADWWSNGTEREPAPLPDDLAAELRAALEQAAGAERYLEQELRRCFGVDALAELVRQESTEAGAAIALCVPRAGEPVRYRVEFGPDQIAASGQIFSLPGLSNAIVKVRKSIPDSLMTSCHNPCTRY